jgi:hypothetical protein
LKKRRKTYAQERNGVPVSEAKNEIKGDHNEDSGYKHIESFAIVVDETTANRNTRDSHEVNATRDHAKKKEKWDIRSYSRGK